MNTTLRQRAVRFVCLIPALLIPLLMAGFATAQILTGTIKGVVTDATGAVVPGATVTAVDTATSHVYKATSANEGSYTIANLPNGHYNVTIEAKGFSPTSIRDVQVNVSQSATVNAKLQVGSTTIELEVKGAQSTIELESAELKNSVDRRQIMDLPLPTRNPLDLVRTMAGTSAPTASGIGDVFVHGLRGNSTNITQDGVNVADNFVKTSAFFAISAPTVDTVGEFNVSVAGTNTDAGFGAAQVSIVTQRGQNTYHGSVLWFQRTNFLNANTYINNSQNLARPFQLQNRIGFNLGGPLSVPKLYNAKNKTWFFTAFEAYREPLSRNRTRVVLSDAARTGSFTYKRADNGQLNTVNLFAIAGNGLAINPAVMSYYNQFVPSANTDAGCAAGDALNIRCFAWNVPGKNLQNRYTARLDHQLTTNHSLEFVYNQANYNTINDLLNGIEQDFPTSLGGGQASKRQVFTWALNSAFGNNRTNTARFGLQRAPVTFVIGDNFSGTNNFQLGMAGNLTDPSLTSNNLPQGRNTPVRQATDDFAWIKGKHNLRFGGEYRQILANSFFFNTVTPRVIFGNSSTNPDGLKLGTSGVGTFPGGISSTSLTAAQNVLDTISGLIGTLSRGFNHTSPDSGFVPGVPRNIDPISHNFAFYVQDAFKFRPNLTLQAGLRWEYQGVFDLRNGLILQPDDRLGGVFGPAGVGNYFTPNATPAATDVMLAFAGGKNDKPLYKRDWNNFSPFLGFAWDPFKDQKTSIRGGFATHFTQDGFTLFQLASTGNNGLFSVITTNPTGVYDPATINSKTPPPPPDASPVSQKANFALSNAANLWSFDPKLATPYVLEWNLGVQREIGRKVTIEARYVGNHAVKLYRSTNINEVNLFNSPFSAGGASVANILTEFQNAQNNLSICTANRLACTGSPNGTLTFANKGLAGQVPLPILQTLFNGVLPANGFNSATFQNNLLQGQVGTMFDTLRRSVNYAANRGAFPLNFFVANPFANQAILVDNSSWSDYHGLELEARRRFSGGLFFIGNYTFSKTMTDTGFLTSQAEQAQYRTLANRALDKNRAAFDSTHNVSVTALLPLPFGRGKLIGNKAGGMLNALIGGWNLQGLTRWSTGSPFTVSSGRLTTGSLVGETAVLRNMTMDQFKNQLGTFKTPNGVFWINPNSGLVTINGTVSSPVMCAPGQTTPCFDHPAAGQFGNMPILGFNGPQFFNQDASVFKRTSIPKFGENFNFEIRLEAFDVLNHANFSPPAQNLNSNVFGQLTSIVDTVRGGGIQSRIMQWALRVNF